MIVDLLSSSAFNEIVRSLQQQRVRTTEIQGKVCLLLFISIGCHSKLERASVTSEQRHHMKGTTPKGKASRSRVYCA